MHLHRLIAVSRQTGRRRTIALLGCILVLSFLTGTVRAGAVSGTLPGGTSITVAIDEPTTGVTVAPGAVTVRGTASIGAGRPTVNTALIYVLDVSGSTDMQERPGCGGDQNGDGRLDRVLDCELAAAKALNDHAVRAGTIGEVGVAVFGSTASPADVGPAAGSQLITTPAADTDGRGGRDVDQVFSSAFSNFNLATGGSGGLTLFTPVSMVGDTNYASGIQAALSVAAASTKPNKLVVFLSDGENRIGGNISTLLASVPSNVTFQTFAVGGDSSCTGDPLGLGSLDQIARTTGGVCTPVSNVAALPDILPRVIAAQLTSLDLRVETASATPISAAEISPGLPQTGPQTVSYSTTVAGLTPGQHTICVGANGVDGGGSGRVEDCHTITINAPPVADAGASYVGDEGSPVQLQASATDSDNDPLTYAWLYTPVADVDSRASCTFSDSALLNPTITCTDNGVYRVTLTVRDQVYDPVSVSAELAISNVAPTASLRQTGPVDEGTPFSLSLVDATDPSSVDVAAGLSYTFDCDDGTGYRPLSASTTITCPTDDNGDRIVKALLRDKDGGVHEYRTTVTVQNVAPTLSPITAPLDPRSVGTPISTSATFTDPGTADTHTAMWAWGDGSTTAGTLQEINGSGSVSGSHTYTTPGIYSVTLTVVDDDGGSATTVFTYVVIYDPNGGFVTGGGWFNSPVGAYRPDPALTGRANFGFVSKYQRGANVPTGQTQFQFKAGELNFHSTSYEWLVVAGARAQYKGLGTINGQGNYGFLLTAVDGALVGTGQPDKLRIKIWNKNQHDALVYDNQVSSGDTSDTAEPSTVIQSGNIVIHK